MKSSISTILNSLDVSINQASAIIDLSFNYGFAVQCSFTGSPTGSVIIRGSNDKENWSVIDTLVISGTTILSSNRDAQYFPFIQVTKAAGGTGTIKATICIKGA